jgi:hypothetical protein
MRELLYLSTKKLGTFLPDRPSPSVHWAGSAGVGPVSVMIDVSSASPPGYDEATIKAFRRVVGHLEREAGYFTSPDLEAGQWIFFDAKMGFGTIYRDTGLLPPEDDVALFYAARTGLRSRTVRSPLTCCSVALPSTCAKGPPHPAAWGQAQNGCMT